MKKNLKQSKQEKNPLLKNQSKMDHAVTIVVMQAQGLAVAG